MEGTIPKIEDLTKTLKQQLHLHKQLLDLLRVEYEAVVGAKIKDLRDATYAKEAILDEIHREERRRQMWLQELAATVKIPAAELTLEKVAAYYPEQFESLISLRQALIVLIKKAKEQNADNKRLVEVALADTQELKKNILGLTDEKPQVYGPKGQMAQRAGNNNKEQQQGILNREA